MTQQHIPEDLNPQETPLWEHQILHKYSTSKKSALQTQDKYRYNSAFSLTFTLDWDGWLMPHPRHFVSQKTEYLLYWRLGGLQGWSGWVQKISPSPGFDPWTDQTIASQCTNSTVPAHSTLIIYLILIPYICLVGNVIIVMFIVHNHLEKFLIFSVIIFVDWLVLGHMTARSVQAF